MRFTWEPHPTTVGTEPIWWWNAKDLASGAVASWISREGNALNLANGTSNERPNCNLTGYNGKPCVEFDGVNDSLTASISYTGVQLTMFMVIKNNSSGSSLNPNAASLYNTTLPHDFDNMGTMTYGEKPPYWLDLHPTATGWLRGLGQTNRSDADVTNSDTQQIICLTVSDTEFKVYINGDSATDADASQGDNWNINRMTLGKRRVSSSLILPNQYEVSEVLAYDEGFSTKQVEGLFGYFYNEWGITRP